MLNVKKALVDNPVTKGLSLTAILSPFNRSLLKYKKLRAHLSKAVSV